MFRLLVHATLLAAALFALGPRTAAADDERPRGEPARSTPLREVQAPEETSAWDRPDVGTESTVAKMVAKLGRGLVNILTGWLELPKQIIRTSKTDGVLTGMTVGLGKGVGMAVGRTAAGVLETAFFFAPFPGEYKPLIEPALVFD
ncbi:MAG: exosortase system-associated protein, TIGR04073 family [Planctomycetes bacterium]|nr:exosortase system-associated protein, TIGR04073 family [Planctomycetota bacterium]